MLFSAVCSTQDTSKRLTLYFFGKTRFSESGSLSDLEYSFFWGGKPEGERREAGVGFAIKKDIVTKLTEMPRPVSDRIMTMRLPLSKDNLLQQ